MSEVWDKLIELKNDLEIRFNEYGVEFSEPNMEKFNKDNWVNKTWKGEHFRRAHIDVVDARSTKGLWMMHCCIFPHLTNSGPIFGLDVIAGKNKVTGFFHDFSPTVNLDNSLLDLFKIVADSQSWKKERTLPEWATNIFSSSMIAVGNINSNDELVRLINVSVTNCDDWLMLIDESANTCSKEDGILAQNKYAYYQKQNPHTPKVMASLGLNEHDVEEFIHSCLFPEIK
jgi:hypothetical protein